MMYEMNRMLPLFLADNSEELLLQEMENNQVLLLNSQASRKKYIRELKRRFEAVPRTFWLEYQNMSEAAQRLAIFYVLLSTYRLVLDFHLNVTVKKWNSVDPHIYLDDVAMELSQIAAHDAFVDSWSDNTKNRVVSAYLTFMDQAGLFERKSFELHKAVGVTDNEYAYYVQIGQEWFLEACLLHPYEINYIKTLVQ